MRKLPDYLIEDVEIPSTECNDDKCPWHGDISLRKKTLIGRVVSTKMTGTISVEISWLRYVPKYKRYERRRRKIHAHIPPCLTVKEGELVKIVEVRRLAKTVAFVTLGKLKGRQKRTQS